MSQAVLPARVPGSAADRRVTALERALRPEFRVECFIPPAGHYLYPQLCVVQDCRGEVHATGLCSAHTHAWWGAGRPDLASWITDPANRRVGWSAGARRCAVAICPFSAGMVSLCDGHRRRFTRSMITGSTLVEFLASNPPVIPRAPHGDCCFPGCSYPVLADGLCDGHRHTWSQLGRPPLDGLAEAIDRVFYPGFSVNGLPPLVQLELQYLLQVRTDRRRGKIQTASWKKLISVVRDAGVSSVQEHSLSEWKALVCTNSGNIVRSMFRIMLEALQDLHDSGTEWDRDTWRPEKLGFDLEARRGVSALRFVKITQPWLRQLVKRYFRLRLATAELRTVAGQLSSYFWFSRFLAECHPQRQFTPDVIDRPVLEHYIGWLVDAPDLRPGKWHGRRLEARTRKLHLSKLKKFLEAWRRYGWEPQLADDAHIYLDDLPRGKGLQAKFIDEYLMEQIESEDNLTLLDPETRTMVLICRDEGLRIGEAQTLKTDCLQRLPSGRWALVHYKSKDKSYRAIPASRAVVNSVHEQVQRVRARFGNRCVWLFPREKFNEDGEHFTDYGVLTRRFDAWLERIALTDAHGRPATVNWHQFRHTLGTRMANAGVSGRTIREVLGHTSWAMQEHYSRIADDTLRREYEEKYEVRFNPKGQAVRIHPDTDLAGVEWLAEKIGRRLHAVAGGWCGRHIARACPKTAADGCYFCEDFQTDISQLHVHEDTLRRTLELKTLAEQAHRPRVAAKNERMADAIRHLLDRVGHDQAEPPSTRTNEHEDAH